MNRFLLLIFMVFIFSSCIVSKKRFDDMVAQKLKAQGELSDESQKLNQANISINQANALINRLNGALSKLRQDSINLNAGLQEGQKKLAALNNDFETLNNNYKLSLNKSGKLSKDLSQQRDQLLVIQSNLERIHRANDSLSQNLAAREKRVNELEQVLQNKDKAVQNLKNKISNALINFKENELTVQMKNGKVYVSLNEELLFSSGSIEVDKKGAKALQQLAKAIKDQHDIHVMIEGHTDNVPILTRAKYFEDNWDLSVLRATSVTRILINAGMPPTQITAGGTGQYYPIASNDTKQDRQKNRRTDIIVTPNLDELFKILESN